MRFSIDPRVFELFPDLQLVVLVARDIDNTGQNSEIRAVLDQERAMTKELFATVPVAEHPNIANWRDAYARMHVGSDFRSSIEALVRRAPKGVPSINPLVDLYNAASLKYLIPIGGEDVRAIQGEVWLTIADGSEQFSAIGHTENDPPEPGEVVYVDAAGCICRRFNWREADRTQLTPETKSGLLVLEGLPPVGEIELKEAASFLEHALHQHTGATVELFYLHQDQPSISFEL